MSNINSEIYGRLSNDQEKALRNLELVISESLLRMVEGLGVKESEEMVNIREIFAKNLTPDDEVVNKSVDKYWGLCQEVMMKYNSYEATLAANILLIIFYLPRQNDDIINDFYIAIEDAITLAMLDDSLMYDKLLGILNRVF